MTWDGMKVTTNQLGKSDKMIQMKGYLKTCSSARTTVIIRNYTFVLKCITYTLNNYIASLWNFKLFLVKSSSDTDIEGVKTTCQAESRSIWD